MSDIYNMIKTYIACVDTGVRPKKKVIIGWLHSWLFAEKRLEDAEKRIRELEKQIRDSSGGQEKTNE